MDFYSIVEVAAILGIRPVRTRELCRAGRLPGARKVGRCWIVPKDSIKAYKPGMSGRPRGSTKKQ